MREFELKSSSSWMIGCPTIRIVCFRDLYRNRETYPTNPLRIMTDPRTSPEFLREILEDYLSSASTTSTSNSSSSLSQFPDDNSSESLDRILLLTLRDDLLVTKSDPGIRGVLGRHDATSAVCKDAVLPVEPVLDWMHEDYCSSQEFVTVSDESDSEDWFDYSAAGCRKIAHILDRDDYRSKMEFEKDKKLVLYTKRLPRAIIPLVAHAVVEILLFCLLMTGFPPGFTQKLYTSVSIGANVNVAVVLLFSATNASATCVVFVACYASGRYGKRWIGVILLALLSVFCHIYGGAYLVGSAVFLKENVDILMMDETHEGFSSDLWQQSQSFLHCCGVDSYKSWDWNRHNVNVVDRLYPQSCCDPSLSDCKSPPNVKEVYRNGCLISEIATMSIICYSIYYFYAATVLYSGYVCFFTFKMYKRFKWLEKHRDVVISLNYKENPFQLDLDLETDLQLNMNFNENPPTEILYIRETRNNKPSKECIPKPHPPAADPCAEAELSDIKEDNKSLKEYVPLTDKSPKEKVQPSAELNAEIQVDNKSGQEYEPKVDEKMVAKDQSSFQLAEIPVENKIVQEYEPKVDENIHAKDLPSVQLKEIPVENKFVQEYEPKVDENMVAKDQPSVQLKEISVENKSLKKNEPKDDENPHADDPPSA